MAACPPAVEHNWAFRERAVGELDLLPSGSALEGMLANYALLRL